MKTNSLVAGLGVALLFYGCNSSDEPARAVDGGAGMHSGGSSGHSGGSSGNASTGGRAVDGSGGGGGDGGATSSGGRSSSGGSANAKDGGTSDSGSGDADSGTGGAGSTGGEPGSDDAGTGGAPAAPRELEDLFGLVPHQTMLKVTDTLLEKDAYGTMGSNGPPGEVVVLARASSGLPVILKFKSGKRSWSYNGYAYTLGAVAGASGEAFYAGGTTGTPNDSARGTIDAIVGKLKADGSEAWSDHWGATGRRWPTTMSPGPNGSVLAAGMMEQKTAGSQFVTDTALWLARYEADGTRTFLKEFPKSDQVQAPTGLLVDAKGNAYVGTGPGILKFDVGGNFVSFSAYALHNMAPFGLATGAANGSPFTWNAERTEYYELVGSAPLPTLTGLFEMRLDGAVDWHRRFAQQQRALNDQAGTTWTGTLGIAKNIAATSDSLYLVGACGNKYVPAGTIVPSESNAPDYIGRYDHEGNLIWIQEFSPTTGSLGTLLSVWPDVDGNPSVLVSRTVDSQTQGISAFKFSKADGTLL